MRIARTVVATIITVVCALPAVAGGATDAPGAAATSATASQREAPMLAAMVASGDLPPVEERLPDEPLVIQVVEEIGQYGGRWRFGIPSRGQLGVYSYATYDFAARWNRPGQEIVPNVLESWQFSDDGRSLTMFLRRGMKWSDGHPFTADDLLFWFDDIIGNDELNPNKPGWLLVAGQLPTMQRVDDYTVRMSFAAPPGLLLENFATTRGNIFAPKHYLEQFHTDYADANAVDDAVKAAGLDDWGQLFGNRFDWYFAQNVDYPVLNAWVVKTPLPGTQTTYERNPYYWKVDPAGNQLPYIDEVTVVLTTTAETLNLKAMAGEFDFQMRYLSPSNFTLFFENQQRGDYRVLQWPTGIGSDAALFPNLSAGDPAVRALTTNPKFRQALSLAINREEINKLVFQGRGQPRQATVVNLSPLYEPRFAEAFAEFDAARANRMLDELGLDRRGSDGFRLRPDGEPLTLIMESPGEKTQTIDSIELVLEYWAAVGIKAIANHTERSAFRQRAYANELDVAIWEMGFMVYPVDPQFLIPVNSRAYGGPEVGRWYVTGGNEGLEPSPDLAAALDLFDQIKATPDPSSKNELFKQILELQAENLYVIGLVGDVREILIAKNNFRNVPEESIFDSIVGRYIGLTGPEQYFVKQ